MFVGDEQSDLVFCGGLCVLDIFQHHNTSYTYPYNVLLFQDDTLLVSASISN